MLLCTWLLSGHFKTTPLYLPREIFLKGNEDAI
jgi:hypothetical protein